MSNKLFAAIALTGALSFSQHGAHALGLGEIDVDSRLNEPLLASIPLIESRTLDASQILVNLASNADFQRANIEKPYFLSSIKFDVYRAADGEQYLQLKTRDIIREPYINFLLDIRWPEGRILREYLVLLDLPEVATSTANPALARKTSPMPTGAAEPSQSSRELKPTSSPISQPATVSNETAVKPAVKQKPAQQQLSTGDTVTVAKDQTLWSIAESIGYARNAGMLATVDALVENNPEAFVDGDKNRLKAGATIEVPSLAYVQQIANRGHDDLAGQRDPSTYVDSESYGETVNAIETEEVKPSMRLASASDVDTSTHALVDARNTIDADSTSAADAPVNTVSLANQTKIVKLENDLTVTLEQLDKASIENEELSVRLAAMEQRFRDLESLMLLRSEEVDALKTQLAATANTSIENLTADTNDFIKPAEPAKLTSTNSQEPISEHKDPVTKVIGFLQHNIVAIAGVGLGILVLLLMLVMRKRESVERVEPALETDQQFENADPALDELDATANSDDIFEDEYEIIIDDEVSASDELAGGSDDDVLFVENEQQEAVPFVLAGDEVAEGGEFDQIEQNETSLSIVDDSATLSAETEVPAETDKSDDLYDEDFGDEVATKLDLARAYVDMGDYEAAREILDEVLEEGDDAQRGSATEMLAKIA